MKLRKTLVSGNFIVELWDYDYGDRAYLKVQPTSDNGMLYWDCATDNELSAVIDKAIDELHKLKRKSFKIIENNILTL